MLGKRGTRLILSVCAVEEDTLYGTIFMHVWVYGGPYNIRVQVSSPLPHRLKSWLSMMLFACCTCFSKLAIFHLVEVVKLCPAYSYCALLLWTTSQNHFYREKYRLKVNKSSFFYRSLPGFLCCFSPRLSLLLLLLFLCFCFLTVKCLEAFALVAAWRRIVHLPLLYIPVLALGNTERTGRKVLSTPLIAAWTISQVLITVVPEPVCACLCVAGCVSARLPMRFRCIRVDFLYHSISLRDDSTNMRIANGRVGVNLL